MDAPAVTPLVAAADPGSGHKLAALLLLCSPWLLAGAVVGAFHFLSLRTTTGMLAAPSSLKVALTLHLLRWIVTTAALIVIARHGAAALLAATAGVLAARTAVMALHRVSATPPPAAAAGDAASERGHAAAEGKPPS